MLAIMPPFHIRIQTNHMNSSRFNQTGPKIGLSVRLAETQAEIEAAQRLRYRVFAEELGADIPNTDGRDIDPYDEHCHHLLAFDDATGAWVRKNVLPKLPSASVTFCDPKTSSAQNCTRPFINFAPSA